MKGRSAAAARTLFPVLEVEGYQAMIAELDKPPVNITWQARMADLLDVVHDCSAQGACAPLPVVWNCDRSSDRVRHRWTPTIKCGTCSSASRTGSAAETNSARSEVTSSSPTWHLRLTQPVSPPPS